MPAQSIETLPRAEFIERNLGLVHACAGRFKGRGIEYEELYAAGCLGLVKACDGFDTGRGVCFSTYAVPVILGEIKKTVPRRRHGQSQPFPQRTEPEDRR